MAFLASKTGTFLHGMAVHVWNADFFYLASFLALELDK
jgi:hypothetical protein